MGANDLDSKVIDNLLAGDNVLLVTRGETILTGQGVLVRGSVLGRQTSGGKMVLVDSDGTDDGRRAAYAILAETVDTGAGDVVSVVYMTGIFNEDALIFSAGDDKEDYRSALRLLNIHLKTVISA